MIPTPLPPLALLRRWVVDYFNAHNPSAAREFIHPDYSLEIGDVVFAGRDQQWLPAVDEQMRRFPGLGMTVHEVVTTSDQVALWFSQHGAQDGANGPVAVWSGVAIYQCRNGQMLGCVAQEDYLTRTRQLKSGVPDPVEPPAPAPWDAAPQAQDPEAERIVQQCLISSWPSAEPRLRCDDEHLTGDRLMFEVDSVEVLKLFSSGQTVAFHARQHGRYQGGLAGAPVNLARQHLVCNGIVQVQNGEVIRGRVIRDRIGLRARLRAGASS